MGMDGLYRPAQALGYTDPVGHLNASDRAANTAKHTSHINKNDEVKAINKDSGNKNEGQKRDQPDKSDDQAFAEELKELFILQFNLNLDPDVVYRFNFNELTERFELIDTSVNMVLLTLTPEDFLHITENMNQNSGIISNRIA